MRGSEAAVEITTLEESGFLRRGNRSAGIFDGAVAELRKFVDLNESRYDAHLELNEIYAKLGRKEEAISVLKRAIGVYPFDADAHRNLAALYQEQGRNADVIVEKCALVALGADRAQGLYELALAYYEGDLQSAKRELLGASGFEKGLALPTKLSPRSEG